MSRNGESYNGDEVQSATLYEQDEKQENILTEVDNVEERVVNLLGWDLTSSPIWVVDCIFGLVG